MKSARILQACDAAVALINSNWKLRNVDDFAERSFVGRINLTEDAPAPLSGRRIFVFPGPYTSTLLTRGDQQRIYSIYVLMVERYVAQEDQPTTPPRKWLDERMNFFEQNVFNLLVNPALDLIDQMTPALDEPAAIEVLYDRDLILQQKTFWCWASFPFFEDTDWTGGVSP